jgi:hypothetical protein
MLPIKHISLIFSCGLFFLSCSSSVGDDKLPVTVQTSDIFSMNADGSGSKQLTNDRQNIYLIRYLPKTDKIVFTETAGLYVVNSDGSQKRLLSNQLGNDFAISNNEETVYFVVTKVTGLLLNSVLYSVSLSMGGVNQILQDSSEIGGLAISSDGSQMMFNTISAAPKSSILYLLNTTTLEKRKIKEGVNQEYYYPQFIPNSTQILFFDKTDSNQSNSYLRIVDLADTSINRVLDTVTLYGNTNLTLNSKGDIFYNKNGITVLNIYNGQKRIIPFLFYPATIVDNINWSSDESTLIFTDNLYNRIIMYNLVNLVSVVIKPTQSSQAGMTIGPLSSPFLNYNNSKIFYVIQSSVITFI